MRAIESTASDQVYRANTVAKRAETGTEGPTYPIIYKIFNDSMTDAPPPYFDEKLKEAVNEIIQEKIIEERNRGEHGSQGTVPETQGKKDRKEYTKSQQSVNYQTKGHPDYNHQHPSSEVVELAGLPTPAAVTGQTVQMEEHSERQLGSDATGAKKPA